MTKLFSISCLFCILPLLLSAQINENKIDRWDFGILIGTNGTKSKIETYSLNEIGFANELSSVNVNRGAGPELGILASYHCSSLLSIKTEPSIAFTEVSYMFDFAGEETLLRVRESVNMELPLHLLIESQTKKFTPAFTLGARYVTDFANDTGNRTTDNISFEQEDIMLDLGLGIAATFKKFKVRYEFMYSKGLLNQAISGIPPSVNNPFSEVFNNRLRGRLVFYM